VLLTRSPTAIAPTNADSRAFSPFSSMTSGSCELCFAGLGNLMRRTFGEDLGWIIVRLRSISCAQANEAGRTILRSKRALRVGPNHFLAAFRNFVASRRALDCCLMNKGSISGVKVCGLAPKCCRFRIRTPSSSFAFAPSLLHLPCRPAKN
jgi:hypothetical protein